jgi:predicted dehydrogenase
MKKPAQHPIAEVPRRQAKVEMTIGIDLVPALRALSDNYEIVGVANTSLASAQRAAAVLGLPRAFNDVAELVFAPEVDIVTVTVKVPHHLEVVKAAIEAGKHETVRQRKHALSDG